MLYGNGLELGSPQPKQKNIWKRYGKLYKCGCCGQIPYYVDISERNICYACKSIMTGYEDENGQIQPMKHAYKKGDESFARLYDFFV